MTERRFPLRPLRAVPVPPAPQPGFSARVCAHRTRHTAGAHAARTSSAPFPGLQVTQWPEQQSKSTRPEPPAHTSQRGPVTWDPCGPFTETQPEPKCRDRPSGGHLRSQLQGAGDPAELVGLRWALVHAGPWASRLGATCADGRGMVAGWGARRGAGEAHPSLGPPRAFLARRGRGGCTELPNRVLSRFFQMNNSVEASVLPSVGVQRSSKKPISV